jgi:hypothetical protein
MARTIVIAAAALLLGIFVGGIGPRREVTVVRKELTEAKAAARGASGGSTAAASFALGLGSLMAAQERAREQATRAPRVDLPTSEETTVRRHAEEQPRSARAGADAGTEDRRGPFGLGDQESFKAAAAAADLRAAQYRAAFLDEANLSPEQQTAFEDNIARMNGELAQAANEVAAALDARAKKLGPRDMADVGARALDIYRRADDKFKAGLDDKGRAALEKTDFDLLTQVDLGGLRRLADTVEQLGVSTPRRAP